MLLIVLMVVVVAMVLYHDAVNRFQQKFIAEYEESRRQTRPPRPSAGETTGLEYADAPEESDAGYADVLAQLEQRRKEQRRPKPR